MEVYLCSTPGDRIVLIRMPNDPCPIPPGSTGTVRSSTEHKSLGFTQVSVDWDNGRGLLLTIPPDEVRRQPCDNDTCSNPATKRADTKPDPVWVCDDCGGDQ